MPLHVSVNDKEYKHHAYAGPEAGNRRQESQGRQERQVAGGRRQEGPGPGASISSQKEFLGKAVKKKKNWPIPDSPDFYFSVKQNIWDIWIWPIFV